MKDNSSKQLRSRGGRLNEKLVAWQRTREADEKPCRLIRKPGRLHDEKAETWPVMENWQFTGSACVLMATVSLSDKTGPPRERQKEWSVQISQDWIESEVSLKKQLWLWLNRLQVYRQIGHTFKEYLMPSFDYAVIYLMAKNNSQELTPYVWGETNISMSRHQFMRSKRIHSNKYTYVDMKILQQQFWFQTYNKSYQIVVKK